MIDSLRKAHSGNLQAVLEMVISHQGLSRKVSEQRAWVKSSKQIEVWQDGSHGFARQVFI